MTRSILVILLVVFNLSGFAQSQDSIPIRIISRQAVIPGPYKLILSSSDTTFAIVSNTILKNDINNYSVRVCYDKHRVLISQREDEILFVDIYIHRKTFNKELGGANFGRNKMFKKYYYVDLGIGVVFRIPRSEAKKCRPGS